MEKIDYLFGIQRTFSDINKFLIGVLLSIIPLVGLVAVGYQVEAGALSLKKKKDLPEWKDWGNLFVRGLLVAVISAIYILPAMIVLMGGLGAIIWATLIKGNLTSFGQPLFWMGLAVKSIPIFVIVILLLLMATYLIPSAIMHYVETGKFGKAFELDYVLRKAFRLPYFITWFIVMVVCVLLTGVLMPVPIIGWGLGRFTSGMYLYTTFGQIYKRL